MKCRAGRSQNIYRTFPTGSSSEWARWEGGRGGGEEAQETQEEEQSA